mmetsp:Transcript_27360/g.60235  ORF Transcript_27360/g.60235 Transcript_27360/m.60235 type:complete len:248 (+) Transcript_27360:393-1136(+)
MLAMVAISKACLRSWRASSVCLRSRMLSFGVGMPFYLSTTVPMVVTKCGRTTTLVTERIGWACSLCSCGTRYSPATAGKPRAGPHSSRKTVPYPAKMAVRETLSENSCGRQQFRRRPTKLSKPLVNQRHLNHNLHAGSRCQQSCPNSCPQSLLAPCLKLLQGKCQHTRRRGTKQLPREGSDACPAFAVVAVERRHMKCQFALGAAYIQLGTVNMVSIALNHVAAFMQGRRLLVVALVLQLHTSGLCV